MAPPLWPAGLPKAVKYVHNLGCNLPLDKCGYNYILYLGRGQTDRKGNKTRCKSDRCLAPRQGITTVVLDPLRFMSLAGLFQAKRNPYHPRLLIAASELGTFQGFRSFETSFPASIHVAGCGRSLVLCFLVVCQSAPVKCRNCKRDGPHFGPFRGEMLPMAHPEALAVYLGR